MSQHPLHRFPRSKSATSWRAKVRCICSVCCVVSFPKFHYNDLLPTCCGLVTYAANCLDTTDTTDFCDRCYKWSATKLCDVVQVCSRNMKSTRLTEMVVRMLILSACYRCKFLIAIILACAAVESFVLRGPGNVVGTVDENVTLKCHTNESQKVNISISSVYNASVKPCPHWRLRRFRRRLSPNSATSCRLFRRL